MAYRFEFDPINKILMCRFEGQLTDDLLQLFYDDAQTHAIATDPRTTVVDLVGVTKFAVASEFIRALTHKAPVLPHSTRQRFVVVPDTAAYGLIRMFELAGGDKRPAMTITRSLEEVWSALGTDPPHFEPLE